MGELIIDNRVSGGIKEEYQTVGCKHCQAVLRMILAGVNRTREGAFCLQCSGPICETCAARHFQRPEGPCEAFERRIDAWQRQQTFRAYLDQGGR
jgi:hypothetical protein